MGIILQAHDFDKQWMQRALFLAQMAQEQNEVPVGAVIVYENQIIGEGYNAPIATHDSTAHAEIQAIRAASLTLNNYRLVNTTLYVTLEPCAMCAGAILHARIPRVVFGALDPRAGAVHSVFNLLSHPQLNHRCEIKAGVLAQECGSILTRFFQDRRRRSNA